MGFDSNDAVETPDSDPTSASSRQSIVDGFRSIYSQFNAWLSNRFGRSFSDPEGEERLAETIVDTVVGEVELGPLGQILVAHAAYYGPRALVPQHVDSNHVVSSEITSVTPEDSSHFSLGEF